MLVAIISHGACFMQFELTKELLSKTKEIIASGDEKLILELINDLHPADISEIIFELEIDEARVILHHLTAKGASEVISHLDDDVRLDILNSYTPLEIAEKFIEYLESDDAADILQDLDDKKKEEVISYLEDLEQAGQIVDLLSYDDGSAGSLMGKELVKVYDNITVTEAVRQLRKQAGELDNIYSIYVVDKMERLLGILSLKKLLVADQRSLLSSIIKTDILSVKVSAKDVDVASMMQKYDLVAVPVIDELGRLVGRITIDDVVDVIRDEAEKDYQLASGLSENVESSDSIWLITRARIPWLILGLIGGIFGARVIGVFEYDIQLYPEMAFFIPLVAAMGGNVGVQSSAIVVQGLANNSIGMDGILPKLLKEFSVALINALVCAAIVLVYNLIFSDSLALSYTVSLALMAVIIFAALFGTFIPLALQKYEIDPALATGPFITTVNDILGLFIYFSIGRLMYGFLS